MFYMKNEYSVNLGDMYTCLHLYEYISVCVYFMILFLGRGEKMSTLLR